jgi:hypothetical protein
MFPSGCSQQQEREPDLLTSSFNHVVDEAVAAVYDYFQPRG